MEVTRVTQEAASCCFKQGVGSRKMARNDLSCSVDSTTEDPCSRVLHNTSETEAEGEQEPQIFDFYEDTLEALRAEAPQSVNEATSSPPPSFPRLDWIFS
eukprot:gb/GFBE01051224.1/.p1 GENE.gb/GFBE01051224.1/~~gb/GFBE01051224.1/.p1  ORF type:complete len:100 (+),score=16.77 gb/GFBE01051224.1/:1-300(+)